MILISKFRTLVRLFLGLLLVTATAKAETGASIKTLEERLRKQPQNTRVREALGGAHLKMKNYKATISVLAPYANEISNDGLIDLASAYTATADSMNEIRVLQLFVEKNPRKFRPHYLLGLAFKRNKKLDDAAKSLRQAIAHAPKHRPSYDTLLEIFLETKQNYESRTLLGEMIQAFGDKKEFSNASCRLYAIDNFLKEALHICQKAIRQNPRFPDNHIYLAQTYYNQGNKVAAEKIFRKAGSQFTKSEFVQYAVGEFYLNEKNFPTAVRYLQNAVKANPATKRAQLTLALALYEAKEYGVALAHFEKSCKLDKTNESVTILKNSAARLRQANQTDLAQKYDFKAATCQSL